jgi:hypothetical protein
MLTESPQIAGRAPWCLSGIFEGRVEIEVLDPLLLLSGLQAAEQVTDFVLGEPREGQIDRRARLKVGKQPGEELLVPEPRDLVERQVQETRLLYR